MYIPKNQIETNLKTKLGEFFYKEFKTEYKGFYHKLSNGKYFTGKTPSSFPKSEIIKQVETQSGLNTIRPTSRVAFIDAPTIITPEGQPTYKENLVVRYSELKDIPYIEQEIKKLPYNISPPPTPQNYKDYEFKRYFVIKVNEPILYEVSKEIYDAISSKNKSWEWELFNPFSIIWTLKGKREEITNINKNSVSILERKLKINNLHHFLGYDYLKYYVEG